MPLYKQIAGPGGSDTDAETGIRLPDDVAVPVELVGPVNYLINLGVLSPLGTFNEARYRFLNAVYPSDKKVLLNSAVQFLMDAPGTTVGNFFDDAFKGIQHAAAGMGMQVPRASFLILVRMNAFGYANKLNKALQFTDTREKLEDLWWRVGGQPDVLRSVIAEGATKPAATSVSEQDGKLKELALAGGTYKDANGVVHDINTGAVVSGAGMVSISGASIGILPVVAAGIISSAAVIVAAIMPIISKLLDKHGAAVPGLPVDPVTGLPIGYAQSGSITSFIQNNPLVVAAIAAALGYYIYENY